jgi:plasmid stabilization system protein ParE
MPYELEFTDTALEDLERLVESLRPEIRAEAIDQIEAACRSFIARPPFRARNRFGTPTFPIQFTVQGTMYRWVGAFSMKADEQTFSVEHVFRVPL